MTDYPQEKSGKDLALASAKAATSLIPIAGAPLVEILNLLVTPSLQKRRDEWFEKLGKRLKKLEDSDFITLEELQTNDTFIDISLKATELALKTSEKEKINALRNALINSIIDEEIDLSIKQIFLNYIDSFTVWHIKLLKLFHNPSEYKPENTGSTLSGDTSNLILKAYPELKDKKDFYKQVLNDLSNSGLMLGSGLGITMSSHSIYQKRSTEFGDKFLSFIAEEEQ